MKLRMYIEANVSKTVAETMQRSGFSMEPDGSGMKIKIPNTPTITRRKLKVHFVENPDDDIEEIISKSSVDE